jgi:hypothetical protein
MAATRTVAKAAIRHPPLPQSTTLYAIDRDHDTIAERFFSHGVVFLLALDEYE